MLGHAERRGNDEAWYWGGDSYPGRRYPYIYSLYPGLAVSLAALAGALVGWRRLGPWLAMGSIGFLLALGVNGPLWGPVRHLPVLSGLRYPERFVLLFSLALLVVAAHGFDWIGERSGRVRRMVMWGFGMAAGAGFVAAACLVCGDWLSPTPWSRLGVPPQIESRFAGVAAADALRVGIVALGGLLAVLALRRRRRLALLALACWTAVDLAVAGRLLVPSVSVDRVVGYPEVFRPLVERPPSGPLFHLAAEDLARPLAFGLAKPPVPAQWGISMTLERDVDRTSLRWTARSRELFWGAVRKDPTVMPALLQRRSVGAILKFRPGVRVLNGRLDTSSAPAGPLELAIPAKPKPLAFAAERVVSLADEASWVGQVLGLGDEIPGTASVRREDAQGIPERPSPARVTMLEFSPGRMTLDVLAAGPQPSFIAVNQTWDEGWSAFVDGNPDRLLRVDVALSGLAVPPGRHRVALVYSDAWVSAGVVISLTAVLMVLLVLLFALPSVSEVRGRPPGRPRGRGAEGRQTRTAVSS
ncbi:MAG: hypothetical protein IPL90_04530 [Holophagales bacterium]|nr:hypothetical protein [Holophagales bacterium]